MVEAETVRRLLQAVEERLRRLEDVAPASVEEYVGSQDLQDVVERNLEVMIQACIDLGLHVLADVPGPVPESYRAVFARLAREGLLPTELASRLEGMAGFRNLLVHGYTRIVPEQVYASLSGLGDVRAYVRELTRLFQTGGILPP